MDAVIAIAAGAVVLLISLGLAPSAPPSKSPNGSLMARLERRHAAQLKAARLTFDPRRFTLITLTAPPLLLVGGMLLGSPVVAVAALGAGFFVPRLYLDWLVAAQQRRTEAEAPRLLQVMVASLAAGRTYLDAIEEARTRISDRWLRADLDYIVRQFHLDVPLEDAIADVRALATGRNLPLVWDNLSICIANRIPAAKAKGLFVELSSTVQFNVQLEQEVRAKTSGQRAQIWLLAAIVPGLFFYLRLINPDFFTVLDATTVGRYVLFPAAVGLEALGLILSFRVARVDA